MTEQDFTSVVEAMEQRLDHHIEDNRALLLKFMEMAKDLTVVTTQQGQTNGDIADIRSRLTALDNTHTAGITKVHERLDTMTQELRSEQDELRKHALNNSQELSKWLNRGWGIILVLALLSGVFQWLANKGFTTIQATTEAQTNAVEEIKGRLSELEDVVTNLVFITRTKNSEE